MPDTVYDKLKEAGFLEAEDAFFHKAKDWLAPYPADKEVVNKLHPMTILCVWGEQFGLNEEHVYELIRLLKCLPHNKLMNSVR